jgi:transposase
LSAQNCTIQIEEENTMNAVGIDVSKGKSTVAVLRPGQEVLVRPFEVAHTGPDLRGLADFILSLEGETKVVMEATGKYSVPIAESLAAAGIFVSVVNAKRTHDYGGDTIRRRKTDPLDAKKLACFCLDKWANLKQFQPPEELRKALKLLNRQIGLLTRTKTQHKNNLISLLDQTFPGIEKHFKSPERPADGHQAWVDFVSVFWHCECVCALSLNAFTERYRSFCKKNGYRFMRPKAQRLHEFAKLCCPTLPKDDCTKCIVQTSVKLLLAQSSAVAALKNTMSEIAQQLPEYETVLAMFGVGPTIAPQLMAELGDVRNFEKRTSLACFAGIEPPEKQSGQYNQKSRRISKQGSPHLRRALFMVMRSVLQTKNAENPIYRFIDRKRAEGKPYKVYMVAGMNKFLRIYYAKVMAHYEALEVQKATEQTEISAPPAETNVLSPVKSGEKISHSSGIATANPGQNRGGKSRRSHSLTRPKAA